MAAADPDGDVNSDDVRSGFMSVLRRVPQRTCISCGVKTDKRELLRLVSEPDDGVVVDSTGKKNGRGAYLCVSCRSSSKCLRRDRVEYALRTKIDEDNWKALVGAMKFWREGVETVCT